MSAAPAPAAFLGRAKTAHYRPRTLTRRWLDPDHRGLYSVSELERMRHDPQVAFGLGILEAPLSTVKHEVEDDDPDVAEFADAAFRRIWQQELPHLFNCVVFENTAAEVIYKQTGADVGGEDEDGNADTTAGELVEFDRLKPLYPFDCAPLERHGQLAGIAVHGLSDSPDDEQPAAGWHPDWIGPPRSLWIANEPEFGSLWGRSILRPVWYPWSEKAKRHGAYDVRRLWYAKNAFDGDQLYYPEGSTLIDGRMQDNGDYAREIVENKEAGAVLAWPNTRIGPEGTGDKAWEYVPAKVKGDLPGVHDYIDKLDAEILRAMKIPPEVVAAAESGSGWAGRTVPFLVFLTREDKIASQLMNAVKTQIIDYLVLVNFGERAKDRYKLTLKSLVPESVEEQAKEQKGQGQAGVGGMGQVQGGAPPPGKGQSEWAPFRGKRGGKGMKNRRTGAIVYGNTERLALAWRLASEQPVERLALDEAEWLAWVNRGPAKKPGQFRWYNPETKQYRQQKSEPGTGRGGKAKEQPQATAKQEQAPAKKARAAAKAKKPTVDSVHAHLSGLIDSGQPLDHAGALALIQGVLGLTKAQIKEVAGRLEAKLPSKGVKAEQAAALVDKVMAGAGGKGQEKPQEEPAAPPTDLKLDYGLEQKLEGHTQSLKLSAEETEALRNYSLWGYRVNEQLRAGREPATDVGRGLVAGLDGAIAKVPVLDRAVPAYFYRGRSFATPEDAERFSAQLVSAGEGGTVKMPGYLSTSIDPAVALKFGTGEATNRAGRHPVLIEIAARHGLYLDGHAAHGSKDEREFLLPRDGEFRVVGRRTAKVGGREVVVHQLEQVLGDKPKAGAAGKAEGKPKAEAPAERDLWDAAQSALDTVKGGGAGLVRIPHLYDAVKERVPGLTLGQFQGLLQKWDKDDLLTLQHLSNRSQEPRHGEGIETPGGNLFYVQMNRSGGKGQEKPKVEKPAAAAKAMPSIEQHAKLYADLKDAQDLSVADVRARMEPLRKLPKGDLEALSRHLGYTPSGSREQIFSRLLSNLEGIKMSQHKARQIKGETQPEKKPAAAKGEPQPAPQPADKPETEAEAWARRNLGAQRSVAPATEHSPWHDDAVSAIKAFKETRPLNSIELPELYDGLEKKYPDLSIPEFQAGLRKLANEGHIVLHPFTRPGHEMERPEHRLHADWEHKYYAAPGYKKKETPAPAKEPAGGKGIDHGAVKATAGKIGELFKRADQPGVKNEDLEGALDKLGIESMDVPHMQAVARELKGAGHRGGVDDIIEGEDGGKPMTPERMRRMLRLIVLNRKEQADILRT